MSPHAMRPGRLARIALVLGLVVAGTAGLGLAARPMLAHEEAQAHAYVDEADRALAKGERGVATLALERARMVAPRAAFVRRAIAAARIHDAESIASSAAVVMDDAPARVAPYADAAVVSPLPAGTVVERRGEHASFVRVRSGDGVEGWIPQGRLAPIAGPGG